MTQIDELRERLRPVLEDIDTELSNVHQERINELKDRIQQRAELFSELTEQGMPTPLEFNSDGYAELTDWYPSVEAEDVKVEEVELGGVACYGIEREKFGDFSSSWRRQTLLPRGRYLLEAKVKTEAVIPIPEDQVAVLEYVDLSRGDQTNRLEHRIGLQ